MQVTFLAKHSLRAFLSAKERVEIELASLFSQLLSHSAKGPCSISCEVETELFLVAPQQKEASVVEVTEDNCAECFSILEDSAVFRFGQLFQDYNHHSNTMERGECYI